ncbi:hypothetical protein ABEM04_13100, partial [Escherichia coli]|nr:hypothetical protein [Escherichia coli]
LDFTLLAIIWDGIEMHKWVLVTHRWTSNLSMEVLENTENDLQFSLLIQSISENFIPKFD